MLTTEPACPCSCDCPICAKVQIFDLVSPSGGNLGFLCSPSIQPSDEECGLDGGRRFWAGGPHNMRIVSDGRSRLTHNMRTAIPSEDSGSWANIADTSASRSCDLLRRTLCWVRRRQNRWWYRRIGVAVCPILSDTQGKWISCPGEI